MKTNTQFQARRNSFPSFVILFGLALLSSSIYATPNPPVFTAIDGQELDNPNQDDRYSLEDAIRGLPFTVNLPIPPQVESEQVVTPSTLGSHINTRGMRLILEPGDYGNRTFNSQDQQIILREGVYFGNVSIGGSARRISIRNEVARSGNMARFTTPEGGWGGFPEDIFVDGIRSDAGANVNFIHGQRIAIINSFIRTVDFPLSAFNGLYNDIIIANCSLENYGGTVQGHTEQAGVRFHNVNRFVFVDNRVSKTGGTKHVFRLHAGGGADIDYAYIGRNNFGNTQANQISPQGTGTPTSDVFHNIWYEDNYHSALNHYGSAIMVAPERGALTHFSVRRNNYFGPARALFGTPGSSPAPDEPGWIVEGNTMQPYQPPPAWEFK